MYHKMNVDWPCLSFDVVPDKLGMGRTKFPLSCTVVAGTQADSHGSNKLMVMRFSSLHRTQHDGRDSDSDVSDDDDEDDDAELEVERISHPGAVNRVRVMPQEPHIVAAWSETGKVNLFDVRPQLRLLDAHEGKGAAPPIPRGYGPVKTFSGHKSEGFAVAWSGAAAGRLATGDCKGRIFVWEVDQAAAGA
jgi:ribosome assembly protein RRB1